MKTTTAKLKKEKFEEFKNQFLNAAPKILTANCFFWKPGTHSWKRRNSEEKKWEEVCDFFYQIGFKLNSENEFEKDNCCVFFSYGESCSNVYKKLIVWIDGYKSNINGLIKFVFDDFFYLKNLKKYSFLLTTEQIEKNAEKLTEKDWLKISRTIPLNDFNFINKFKSDLILPLLMKRIEDNAEKLTEKDWMDISQFVPLSDLNFIHKFKGDLDWFVISNRRDLTNEFKLEFGKELSDAEIEFNSYQNY